MFFKVFRDDRLPHKTVQFERRLNPEYDNQVFLVCLFFFIFFFIFVVVGGGAFIKYAFLKSANMCVCVCLGEVVYTSFMFLSESENILKSLFISISRAKPSGVSVRLMCSRSEINPH